MAEEQKQDQGKSGGSGGGSGSGSGNRKRSRRRYFKRKKGDSGKSGKDEKRGAQKDSGGNRKSRSKSQKNRRRRSRSRSGRKSASGSVQKLEIDYTPPESVFIYTHVLRPEQRDSYSFRSEISSGTGRTLDDFDIDLSLLFADGSDRIATLIGQVADQSDADAGPVDDYEDEDQDRDQGGEADNESDSPPDQPAFDETAQANHFQSEDDTPSSFA